MKIDKRRSPILFSKISLKNLGINTLKNSNTKLDEESFNYFNSIFQKTTENICYITKPVLEAIDFGEKDTVEKLVSLRNEIKPIKRCVIMNPPNDTTITSLYSFNKYDDKMFFSILWQFVDNKTKTNYSVLSYGYWDKEDENNKYHVNFGVNDPLLDLELLKEACVSNIELIVQTEVFLQYAKLETKYLKTNQKDSILCRYENKLPFPITIIDSTWYTTLVKSDAFKVRGHFRLQPCGEGLKERKLIWINEFQKEGYTREAKKLSVEV
jgi:hypothetical protein